MKLKDWADKQGISYLTAWRWFKAGDPRLADAYQSDSGTIIVPDEQVSSELAMINVQDSDVMAVVLKKTVEYSKNQYAIEDFAAWILSNFTLKIKGTSDSPKYSRVKPKSEDVQNHFKQFMKPKGEKPKPNMFVAEPDALDDLVAKSNDLAAQELVEEINQFGTEMEAPINPSDTAEVKDLMKDISLAIATSSPFDLGQASVMTYDNVTEGVVTRSVDLTPQQFNYTGSSVPTFSNVSLNASVDSSILGATASAASLVSPLPAAASAVYVSNSFQPTQKELESVARVSGLADSRPKRGRKPSKNLGNK